MKRWLVVAGFVVLLAVGSLLWHPIDRISPREMTATRLTLLEVRFRAFYRENARAPSSLSELLELDGRDNSLVDGWGHPISFSVSGTGVVLSSPGSDGTEGGEGDSADFLHTFDLAADSIPVR
jgi:hypothetical protein